MQVTIFGATGRTGQHLVRHSLDAGHEVVAFARTPSKLEIEHERLSIVQGDVTDAARVREAVAGADAVLSALGPDRDAPAGFMRQAVDHMLAAMRHEGVRRLLVVVGAGVGDPRDRPRLLDRLIGALIKLISRPYYKEMIDLVETVRASDLDWTLVRVPMLVDDPGTGSPRVGYLGGNVGTRLSREDLARFMVAQLESETYLRQAPVVSS